VEFLGKGGITGTKHMNLRINLFSGVKVLERRNFERGVDVICRRMNLRLFVALMKLKVTDFGCPA
jgi:hypothetical protein